MSDKEIKVSVQAVYDMITSQMTPEQALMKMLEGATIQYDHLKFKDDHTPVHPLFIITMAAIEMGWQIAVDKSNEDVIGLVVGTEEYMDKILPKK